MYHENSFYDSYQLFHKQVLVDGSLRDADWYMEYFQQLRNDFPFLRIAILHITAPKEIVLERAAVSAKLI